MSNIKKVLLNELNKRNHDSLMDLLLSDVFKKHRISENQLLNLTDSQKERIRKVFSDIQKQIDQMTQ